jgi:hypothetical protein
VGYYFLKTPCNINIPETEKIIGHSLNAIKLTLNPVNNDKIAIENNITAEDEYTIFKVLLFSLVKTVISKFKIPINIKVNPSFIHSIRMMYLLLNYQIQLLQNWLEIYDQLPII